MSMTGEKQEAIKQRLAELEHKGDGRLTPAAVVKDAQNPKSPLHDQFQWDVGAAAYQHWLDQARELIVTVKYVVRTETTTIRSVLYHRDPNAAAGEQGYVSVRTLQADEDSARAALVDAFRRVGDELRRSRQFALALGFDGEVDKLLNGVIQVRQQLGTMM